MEIRENPFSLQFGSRPDCYVPRLQERDMIVGDLLRERPASMTYVITGLRGSGKTVLLSDIASEFKGKEGWVVVDPGSKRNLLENIVSETYEAGRMKSAFLKKAFSFSFHGITFSVEGREPVTTPYSFLKKMLAILKRKGERLLVTIDEVDAGEEVRSFVECYQALLREDLPIRLLMTGLYKDVARLEGSPSLTFLLRAPKIMLGPLELTRMAMGYEEAAGLRKEEALKAARTTKGYAYAYQALGYILFERRAKRLDEDVLRELDDRLVQYVYEKTWQETPPGERKVVAAFKGEDPERTAEIKERAGVASSFSVYRERLLRRGLLLAPQRGMLTVALPRLPAYIRRLGDGDEI